MTPALPLVVQALTLMFLPLKRQRLDTPELRQETYPSRFCTSFRMASLRSQALTQSLMASDDAPALQFALGDTFFTSITEAFKEAAKIFVPSGSSILVSVHGTRTGGGRVEDGPLQLANSFAEVIVAGARGSGTGVNNDEPPTIFVDRDITKNALGRTPQYSRVYSFSAGVTFADLTLDCQCRQRGLFATINGGFGVGGFDTSVLYRNSKDVGTCATTYGKQAIFQYYNEDPRNPITDQSTVKTFTQTLIDPAENDASINFFGAAGGSGLVSQGCDLILDFRGAGTGNPSNPDSPTCVFKFDIQTTNGTNPRGNIKFFDAGGRGGVKTGGRSGPFVDFDFSSANLDLTQFIGPNFASNQNFSGEFFRVRSLDGTTPQSKYNMSQTTFDQLKAFGGTRTTDGLLLRKGCCVDIKSENDVRGGPFGFYLELEKYILATQGVDPAYKLLRHETATNSFIYGSIGRDISAP